MSEHHATMAGVPAKVSVVVPVYNPGAHIRPLIDSLLRQSLPATAVEAVFVDDGSTDGTPALLDALAAEHPHFVVVHQPNSGWPGKPRNVGLDHATGDYVFFSDNDDWFGDEALERLHACAVRTGADIVIGKMVGHDRGVPRELFRRNRDRATFDNAPLQDSLTPHKLFRRAFLDTHDLRFPEGKRRLEDHVFVMRAYFAADVIAVLADYDCYHHVGRPDESNAGFNAIEPVSYYGYVRETVDIVVANTEPGELRDRLLRRFLRVEVLTRLEGRRFTALSHSAQRALVGAARALVAETMPTSVDDGLPGRQRMLARLLRAGDLRALRRLAFWSLPSVARSATAEWEDDALCVRWSARLGRAGLVRRQGDRLQLIPPGRGADRPTVDVTEDLPRARVELVASDPRQGEVILPGRCEVEVTPDGRLGAGGETRIRFGAGAAVLPVGDWSLRLRARALGWTVDTGLRWPSRRRPTAALVGPAAELVRPGGSIRGALLDVGARSRRLDADFALRTAWSAQPDGVTLRLPVLNAAEGATLPVLVGTRQHDAAVAAADHLGTELVVKTAPPVQPAAVSLVVGGRRDPLPLGVRVATRRGALTAERSVPTAAQLRLRRRVAATPYALSPAAALADRARRRLLRRQP